MPSVHEDQIGQTLYSQADLRAMLGNIGQRKFKAMQAAGIVPQPLELGPRVPRWTHQDYLTIIASLPRRNKSPEPQTLAEARRERIEAMKAGRVA